VTEEIFASVPACEQVGYITGITGIIVTITRSGTGITNCSIFSNTGKS